MCYGLDFMSFSNSIPRSFNLLEKGIINKAIAIPIKANLSGVTLYMLKESSIIMIIIKAKPPQHTILMLSRVDVLVFCSLLF